jgi:hypothetical protein
MNEQLRAEVITWTLTGSLVVALIATLALAA